MKLAVLIPDRGDRPKLLENCKRMLREQTLQPDVVHIVDYEPESAACDITQRYRIGYDALRNKGFDLIALIENDDWYDKDYLKIMVQEWEKFGKPDIIGTNYTIYYHLKLFAHFIMNHDTRASAMNTLIKPDLNFKWCADSEPYTDMHLWDVVKNGVVFKPERVISMGMKHGTGLCVGHAHIDRLHRYRTPDPELKFLQSVMDIDSLNFYSNYFENDNTIAPLAGTC